MILKLCKDIIRINMGVQNIPVKIQNRAKEIVYNFLILKQSRFIKSLLQF